MSAKADIMETVRTSIQPYGVAELPSQLPVLDLSRVILFDQISPAPQSCLWLELHAAKPTVGHSWEGISYVVLWLCGISGIGLSFL